MQKKFQTSRSSKRTKVISLILFAFGLISMPPQLYAQTDCLDAITPNFDLDPPETLCQKIGTDSYPNVFGTSSNDHASQIIAQNNGNNSFTGNIDLVGNFVIDQDFIWSNCQVRIAPGTRITVNSGVTFTLDGSKLFCCQLMWQGIVMEYRSNIVTKTMTEIEDALNAIRAPCTAGFSIQNTIFNRNSVGIRLGQNGNNTSPCHSTQYFTKFGGNIFDCNSPLNLNNFTPDDVTYAGIQVFNRGASMGAITSQMNVFRNIAFGIRFESQMSGVEIVRRCRFENVLGDGIFLAKGNITVERCQFFNCGRRGINIRNARGGVTIQNSNFTYNDDVFYQGSGIFESPLYRSIQIAAFSLGSQVSINHNYFNCTFADIQNEKYVHGIELNGGINMGGGTNIRVDWNTFIFSIIQIEADQGSYGVGFTGEFPISTNALVEFNNFFIDEPVIDQSPILPKEVLADAILITDGNKNNIKIYSNHFNSGSLGAGSLLSADNGIHLEGSMGIGNEIIGNIFDPNLNTFFSNNFLQGIITQDFMNGIFCDNSLKECLLPMGFSGISFGTQYFGNTITGGAISLLINGGTIGEQGQEGGIHYSNKWYDKWINLKAEWQAQHKPSVNAKLSRFWVPPSQSIRKPNNQPGYVNFNEYYPADISPDSPDPDEKWFKQDPTGQVESSDCLDHIIGSGETDRAIASGDIDTLIQDDTHSWMGKRYLYAKLQQNPILQTNYPEFIPFLYNKQKLQ